MPSIPRLPYFFANAMRSTLVLLVLVGGVAAQAWWADYDVSDADFQPRFDLRVSQGFRLVWISARETTGGNRFEMIWKKDRSVVWTAYAGVTSAQHQTQFEAQTKAGLRLLCIDSYGSYPNERYVAIWVKDSVTFSSRHSMTAAKFQTEFNSHNAAKFTLVNVGASGSGSNTRYCAVWVQPQVAYAGAIGQNLTSFNGTIATWKQQGGRLIAVAAAGGASATTFSGVWDFPGKTIVHEQTSLSLNNLLDATAGRAVLGYRPMAVAAYDTASGPRYVVSWSLESSTKVWTAIGPADSGMASFDAAMKTYMQASSISQGALAVMVGDQLKLVRAYTYAPPTLAPTQPQSLFRVCSLTKALTAVGVLRLVQKGRIKLDQKVSAILDMSKWYDSRTREITVRQLLTHFGGWDRTKYAPLFLDKVISNYLNRPLPTDPQMIIDYVALQSLQQSPGTKQIYSNFGYLLLGRIIEKVSGASYEDYMVREVWLPIGASSMRITDSLRGEQIPGEVNYDDPQIGSSVMGAKSPPFVERPYGSFNIRTLDSAGGVVSNVIDYARFVAAFNDPNKSPLLSRALIDEMWKRPSGIPSTDPRYLAMGWAVRTDGNKQNMFHDGSLPGSFTWMYRRSDGVRWVAFFNKRTARSYDIDAALDKAADQMNTSPTSTNLFRSYPSVSSFYTGCPGRSGVPYIRPEAGSLARIGSPFAFEMTLLGPSTTANRPFLYLGGSRTSWSGGALPMRLDAMGMPQCTLNVSPDIMIPLANLGGRARLAGHIPAQPALVGRYVWMQGLVTDPGANPLGAVSTPGAQVQFGMQ